jgi:hypothetical protein
MYRYRCDPGGVCADLVARMSYIRGILHDALMALNAARNQWRYCRTHLRRGGNPDVEF